MIRRRLQQLILGLYAAALLLAAAMVLGPAMNDAAIARDPGRGIATVTSVDRWRATVQYQDEDGRLHTPRSGVLYPTGLREGQRVWVTYAKDNPQLVKVEGRDWRLALLPAGSVALVASLVAVGAWLVVKNSRGLY